MLVQLMRYYEIAILQENQEAARMIRSTIVALLGN